MARPFFVLFEAAFHIIGQGDVMDRIDELLAKFPIAFKGPISEELDRKNATEIRIKAGRCVLIYSGDECKVVTKLSCGNSLQPDDLKCLLAMLGNYALNTREHDIKDGFFTIHGGHRVGVCASSANGLYGLSSLNIRIAREVIGCAKELYPYLLKGFNILVKGKVASGKTTILRDMARWISLPPRFIKTAIIDERRELAAICEGQPQFDIGWSSDVLDGISKPDGCRMAVRALSPEYIICDEIGGLDDIKALAFAQGCGCKIVASVHSDYNHFDAELESLFNCIVVLKDSRDVGRIDKIIIKEE